MELKKFNQIYLRNLNDLVSYKKKYILNLIILVC